MTRRLSREEIFAKTCSCLYNSRRFVNLQLHLCNNNYKRAFTISINLHKRKRAQTACPFPYRSGSTLYGTLVPAIHRIPFIILRLSHLAGLPRFPSLGCSDDSLFLIRSNSSSFSTYLISSMLIVYII